MCSSPGLVQLLAVVRPPYQRVPIFKIGAHQVKSVAMIERVLQNAPGISVSNVQCNPLSVDWNTRVVARTVCPE